MSGSQGRFCWYELMTTDCDAAKRFYGAVVGWANQAAPPPNTDYSLFTVEAKPVAGVMDLPEECRQAKVPSGWTGYVAMDDVDSATHLAAQLAATIRVPPTDIPGVGRFSIITDPQGARLALFKPAHCDGQEPLSAQDLPGGIGWHELWAADAPAAFAFYNQLCGWQKAEAMDMGEMGTYQIFAAGNSILGGMMKKPPTVPMPFWLYYFNVGDIDAAVSRVTEAGGQIVNGPIPVPGDGWIVQGTDPQGAMFALFGKREAGQVLTGDTP